MYLNNGWYYASVSIRGRRKSRSLKTRNKKIAKTRVKKVEQELYKILTDPTLNNDTRKSSPPLPQLVELFLRDKKNLPGQVKNS